VVGFRRRFEPIKLELLVFLKPLILYILLWHIIIMKYGSFPETLPNGLVDW
jgi:hypothetical protein